MKPPVDQIRLSKKAREQLIRLKRFTGIEHWNVLCRWAFCASLSDATTPPLLDQEKAGAVELSWRVFAGDASDVCSALYYYWYRKNCSSDDADHAELIRRHIQRGLGIMESMKMGKIENLFGGII